MLNVTTYSPTQITASNSALVVADQGLSPDHLLEVIVCDLHWTALHIGIITNLLNAHSKSDIYPSLRPWRHLLHDNSTIIRLGLQYRASNGVTDVVAHAIMDLYDHLSDAKLKIGHLMNVVSPGMKESRIISGIIGEWRRLCDKAIVSLEGMTNIARQKLPRLYVSDCDTLVKFLQSAARGESSRVNSWGEIDVPRLQQRRRTPRISTSEPCKIVTSDMEMGGRIEDTALHGLGIMCRQELELGQKVSVVLEDRRRLEATVVRRDADHYGLKLKIPLSSDDRLFSLS